MPLKQLVNKLNLQKKATSAEGYNLLANLFRIAGKSAWQVFIPYIQSIASFSFYSIVQNVYSVLIQTTNLGTKQVILRTATAKVPLLGFFMHALLVAIPQVLIAAFLFKLNLLYIGLVLNIVLLTNLYFNYLSRLKGLKLFKEGALVEFVGMVLFFVGVLFLFIWGGEVEKVLIIEGLMLAVVVAFLLYKLAKIDGNSLLTVKGLSAYFKGIYQVGLIGLIETICWRFIPIYYLTKLTNQEYSVGVFNLCLLLSNVFVLIPQSLLESWIPSIATLDWRNVATKSRLQQLTKQYYQALFVITLLATAAVFIALNSIYIKYYSWLALIMIFTVARIILSFPDINNAVLYAKGKENLLLLPNIVSAFILWVTTFYAAKYYGLSGIFVAFLLSRSLLCFQILWAYNRFNKFAIS
ncbi:MAG: hypothetical protein ACOVQE_06440 [Chitinophagaceae bacterium]